MFKTVLVLLCALQYISATHEYDYEYTDFDASASGAFEEIEDIRLVNGTHGDHTGRVEVLYNGTWGTICDDFWSFADAQVACRMLGFEAARCTVTRARFGAASAEVPIWMSNLLCTGAEENLADCVFNGWGVHSCTHREDAGVVCQPRDLVDPPSNVSVLAATTTTITVGWQVPTLPVGITFVRYRVEYIPSSGSFPRTRFFFTSYNPSVTAFNATITGLIRGEVYALRVRVDVRYSICFTYVEGTFTEYMNVTTNSTLPHSNIPIRLIPPEPGLDFIGRLEVFHGNEWGTVCDDFFSFREAGVICRTLNFTGAVCSVPSARLGQGTGRIWLDDVRCLSNQEILDDCSFRPWGQNNCQHDDDVGVICRPNNFPPPPANVSIVHVGSDSITLRWMAQTFPSVASFARYRILYQASNSRFPRSLTIFSGATEYRIPRLNFGVSYNISIRAEVRFTTCFTYLFGEYSESLTATTTESAPTAPPTDFHVVVINSTAILAQWELPPINSRNGRIRGFKLYHQSLQTQTQERTKNIRNNETMDYIISGLQPATAYRISVAAYTVADGPRSILLTAITYPHDLDPMIVWFGINGDGLTRARRFTFHSNVMVHCGVGTNNTRIDWYFSNGTKVGIMNRNIREGHFLNGTALLHIGSTRRLNYCDAGVYTCVANTSGNVEMKNFTLVVDSIPPPPNQAFPILITSTSATIGWETPECDGGHPIIEFTIQYFEQSSPFSFLRNNILIRNIDPTLRNWTISELTPDTTYGFEVRSTSADFRFSRYSTDRFLTTLPPAPSEPRHILVRLVTASVIEIRWTAPALSNGVIVHYTVYAIPLTRFGPRGKRQALPVGVPSTIKQVFPTSARAGNLTLPDSEVTYQIQMTASVFVNGQENEGIPSMITGNSTIFVPTPGLPIPHNLRVGRSTNSSVFLLWEFPPSPTDTILNFQISYSSFIEWRSPGGTLFRFTEEGDAATTGTSFVVAPLVPGESYQFKVSAATEEGRGEEVAVTWQTNDAVNPSDKLAFFNIRLGPVSSCLEWHDAASDAGHISDIQASLLFQLNRLCSCGLTTAHITNEELSCRGALSNQIVYRARIIGSDSYSSSDLVSLLQYWINSGEASINAGISRLELDPTCNTALDNLQSPDCQLVTVPPTTMSPAPSVVTVTTATPGQPISSSSRAGEVGGIVVGVIIAGLLVGVLVVLLVILLRKWRPKKLIQNNNGQFRMQSNGQDEDKTPFADIEDGARDSGMFDNAGALDEKPAIDTL